MDAERLPVPDSLSGDEEAEKVWKVVAWDLAEQGALRASDAPLVEEAVAAIVVARRFRRELFELLDGDDGSGYIDHVDRNGKTHRMRAAISPEVKRCRAGWRDASRLAHHHLDAIGATPRARMALNLSAAEGASFVAMLKREFGDT